MYSLLKFIVKHHFLFLFAFLQSIALIIYINSHHYQRASFVNSANSVTGNVYQTVSNIEEYFLLKSENERLALEIEKLRALVSESLVSKQGEYVLKEDSLYKQFYTYTTAKVINASTHKSNNYLTLNKGMEDGLEKDMGVISVLGAVGIVKDVSENFATVVPIINKKYNGLSVRNKRNLSFGFLSWNGKNPSKAQISSMSITTDIIRGDTIETTGFSKQFPTGVIVGVVDSVERIESNSTLLVSVKLNVDFSEINHVHIVQNLLKEEWKKLEEESFEE